MEFTNLLNKPWVFKVQMIWLLNAVLEKQAIIWKIAHHHFLKSFQVSHLQQLKEVSITAKVANAIKINQSIKLVTSCDGYQSSTETFLAGSEWPCTPGYVKASFFGCIDPSARNKHTWFLWAAVKELPGERLYVQMDLTWVLNIFIRI